ncbi:MAG: hypothetical protein COT15_03920 [Candidatus Diapherotrites archaeon CG08_land_8_20_14_0_20_34_12]|nr:MAG: hypothetical protein COT15_03920 [Candidatus Diapherotrites archaeon CG08_land_8_20_14_0_20_34_12]
MQSATCFNKECSAKVKLCELILRKYAKVINESETKTIGQIKSMVNPDDLSLASFISEFREDAYNYDKNFLEVLRKIFEFIQKEFTYIELDIELNYWLSSKEIITNKIGDDEDLAMFLCNVARALGNKDCFVIMSELSNLTLHSFVLITIGEKNYILDPCQNHKFEQFSGSREEVIQKYTFKQAHIKNFVSMFNDVEYKQFLSE